MDIHIRDRNHVREILRASEGIPSQIGGAWINRDGSLSHAPMGHPLTRHLHSADFVYGSMAEIDKTKFRSLDDMVEALWMLLQTPLAESKIRALAIGSRDDEVVAEIPRLFSIECSVRDPQGRGTKHRVTFTPDEQRRWGRFTTRCKAVVEGRERAGKPHLHVHSFYPELTRLEARLLLNSIRSNPVLRLKYGSGST
jgi:hypothetical protein